MDIGTTVYSLLRVSTEKQTRGDQLGIQAQREAIAEYCTARGLVLAGEVVELGVSGSTSLEKRKGLLEAITAVVQNKAEALIVAKADRLGRDPLVRLLVEKMLSKTGARIISVAGEGFEDDSPSSVLLRGMLAQIAAYEATMASVRTKAAMKVLKDTGKLYTRPPVGFTTDKKGGLKPTAEAELVLHAVGLRNSGKTLKTIAGELGWTVSKTHRVTGRWMDREDELKSLLAL